MHVAPGRMIWHRETALFVSAILGVAAAVAVFAFASTIVPTRGPSAVAHPQGLSTFASYSQLERYITANAKSAQRYSSWGVGFGGPVAWKGMGLGPAQFNAAATMTMATIASATSDHWSPSFTGTNVQVQGVDELDRVKTDGTRLFVSTANSVSMINAYPPNSTAVASTISFQGANIVGLEIAQNRLVVIEGGQTAYPVYSMRPMMGNPTFGSSSKVELLLYDTTNLSSPKLMQNITIPGSYVGARLADGYVYAVVQQPSYVFNGQGNASAVMPLMYKDGVESKLSPTSVYYTGNDAQISSYTIISSVSMATGKESTISALTGPSSTIYVSTSNIYVVYTNYPDLFSTHGIIGDVYTGGTVSLQDVQQAQDSTVLRASYSAGSVNVAAAGVVPGSILNQFSLDEYDGYFRVATGRFATVGGSPTRSDDVYVLDMGMKQISALKNIAPGENIYAVRFVGETGYVVTFQQIDPLFVISFKDVSNPTVLSALKVSGYSDYLHPLPGGYLIGVGKDAVPSSMSNVAFYTGLKLSLFRVFGNGTSVQIQKMVIGDRGTDSPVLTDHLAFTYDTTRNVTVIPLTLYKVSGNQTTCSGCPPPYGDPVWQGVYVIKVTPSGFVVLGKVSQYPAGLNYGDSPNNSLVIDRSVIIGDYLYTISQGEVMVSALSSFSTVATVPLPS
jgi:inhibitor of cysteine peptidase